MSKRISRKKLEEVIKEHLSLKENKEQTVEEQTTPRISRGKLEEVIREHLLQEVADRQADTLKAGSTAEEWLAAQPEKKKGTNKPRIININGQDIDVNNPGFLKKHPPGSKVEQHPVKGARIVDSSGKVIRRLNKSEQKAMHIINRAKEEDTRKTQTAAGKDARARKKKKFDQDAFDNERVKDDTGSWVKRSSLTKLGDPKAWQKAQNDKVAAKDKIDAHNKKADELRTAGQPTLKQDVEFLKPGEKPRMSGERPKDMPGKPGRLARIRAHSAQVAADKAAAEKAATEKDAKLRGDPKDSELYWHQANAGEIQQELTDMLKKGEVPSQEWQEKNNVNDAQIEQMDKKIHPEQYPDKEADKTKPVPTEAEKKAAAKKARVAKIDRGLRRKIKGMAPEDRKTFYSAKKAINKARKEGKIDQKTWRTLRRQAYKDPKGAQAGYDKAMGVKDPAADAAAADTANRARHGREEGDRQAMAKELGQFEWAMASGTPEERNAAKAQFLGLGPGEKFDDKKHGDMLNATYATQQKNVGVANVNKSYKDLLSPKTEPTGFPSAHGDRKAAKAAFEADPDRRWYHGMKRKEVMPQVDPEATRTHQQNISDRLGKYSAARAYDPKLKYADAEAGEAMTATAPYPEKPAAPAAPAAKTTPAAAPAAKKPATAPTAKEPATAPKKEPATAPKKEPASVVKDTNTTPAAPKHDHDHNKRDEEDKRFFERFERWQRIANI